LRQDDGPSQVQDAPADELHELTRRLRDLSADSDLAAAERAAQLAQLEGELLTFTVEQTRRDPTFAGEHGQPALAWAADWRDQVLEKDLPGADADELVERLLADDTEAWRTCAREAAEAADAQACFDALIECTQVDRDAIARRSDGSSPLPLQEGRGALREAFLEALRADAPEVVRQRAWATRLADCADVALTAVDDLGPKRAAVHIQLVLDDVTWHLDNVPGSGPPRRRLRRKQRRLRRERQELELQGRLIERFGARFVQRFDKLIVWLIFLVLALLFVEVINERPADDVRISNLSRQTLFVFMLLDTAACVVFLLEFFVKLSMVSGRASWFARHFLIDLLPSIPFGLIAVSMGMFDRARAGRALRLVRLVRLTRYARAFGFIARGFDRLGRRYGYLLNHNIVLFPNRAERAMAQRRAESLSRQAWRLRSRLNSEWRELLQSAPREERPVVAAARVEVLESERLLGHLRRPPRGDGTSPDAVRDIPAGVMLRTLDAVTPAELEADLGRDFVVRAARAVRIFARAPLRWLPVVRKYVPRVAPHMSEAEVTAAAAHHISAELGRHHARYFWVADLHGTVTPSEFVDRVGTAMVRGSFQPAKRLTLVGLGYLLFSALIHVTPWEFVHDMFRTLNRVAGPVLIILGGICCLVLGVGWWLKRLAGQATFFYERTINAQFLALTEAIKGRHIVRDAALFDERVFAAESLVDGGSAPADGIARRARFVDAVRSWLVRARVGGELAGVSTAMERAVLLYRDALDGALFTESDNRTTSQLLGSPALRQMRALSGRIDQREADRLQILDLSRARSAIRGPYLWFSLIAKAISQAAARLVVEYNRYAIPLDELEFSDEAERRRYDAWVRTGKSPEGDAERESLNVQRRGYITTAFTALHFLDDDPGRDSEVAERFGPQVLHNLQRDRRVLIREAFGTYPLHTRPKDERVLNLYRLYMKWFAGGRAFLIPLRVFWRWLGMLGRFFRWLVRAVGDVRTPRLRGEQVSAADADFATAVRKIGRMRDPVVWACLRMRARFDPEYLGIRLPGADETGLEGAGWEADLRFLDASPSQVRRLADEQARGEADVRRLARLVEGGLLGDVAASIGVPLDALGREHMRAAAVAYRADFRGARSLLSCEAILDETAAAVMDRPPLPRSWWPRPRLKAAFRRWWRAQQRDDKVARRAMWRSIVTDVNGAKAALVAWARHGSEGARALGCKAISDVLRHPGRVSEQLVTLRVVQTMSLIDLLNYRSHVYRLGDYASLGDEPGHLLELGTPSES